MREEELIDILNDAQDRVNAGKLTINSPEYPLKKLEVLSRGENLTGVASNAPLVVRYCVSLRIELRPDVSDDSQIKGPFVDIIFKIFPRGTSTFPGLIIGFPTLDVEPYGWGFSLLANSFKLDAVSAVLPRLDVERRESLQPLRKKQQTIKIISLAR